MTSDDNELHRTLGRIEGTLKSVGDSIEEVKRGQSKIVEKDIEYRKEVERKHSSLVEEIQTIKMRQNYRDGVIGALFFSVIFFKNKIMSIFGGG